jgi:hypothetical protein
MAIIGKWQMKWQRLASLRKNLRCLRNGSLGTRVPIRAVNVKPFLISRGQYLHSWYAAYRNRFRIIVSAVVKRQTTGMQENVMLPYIYDMQNSSCLDIGYRNPSYKTLSYITEVQYAKKKK